MIHGAWWTAYAIFVSVIAQRAVRDWRNPDENRRVTLITAGCFAAFFAVAGVLIAVLT